MLALALIYLLLPLQDAQLAALRSTAVSLRDLPDDENRETRGATAELTTVKHQFRDWVEAHLAGFAENSDPAAFAGDLRDRMIDADLFCTDFDVQCFPSSLGFLEEVRVSRQEEFLVITTAVGIWCGFDFSAYVYKWNGGEWQRIWENEQNTYTEQDYVPQVVHSVHISAPDGEGNRLLMTLGSKPGCSSAFLPVYYRIWRMNVRNQVESLLVDGSELANLDSDPPIQGRLSSEDALLGMTIGGTGYGDSHQAVRHFVVRDGRAQQVDPIATTPRDFVEEWISSLWTISGPRSESQRLKGVYDRLYRNDGRGDFPDPAMRCTSSPELWQVGAHFYEEPKTYYLVRWKEPYNFTMVDVRDDPFEDCMVPDQKGDDHPSLF